MATDDAIVVRVDRDHDGLCDDSEDWRGLDPLNADTDSDGFSDFIELSIGSNPLTIESPVRTDIDVLRTAAGSALTVPVVFTVTGAGANFEAGMFESGSLDRAEPTFRELAVGVVARFALPEERAVGVDGSRFLGVDGRVRLGVDVNFRYPGGDADCRRMLTYIVVIKRDDGVVVSSRRRLLTLSPPGVTRDAPWCAPTVCY